MSIELAITLPEIARDRLERVLETLRARNADIADRHLLTFIFEMGIIHAEGAFRLPHMPRRDPAGVFSVDDEEDQP
jgi:hypothetical protein